jgi:hypothetical protein
MTPAIGTGTGRRGLEKDGPPGRTLPGRAPRGPLFRFSCQRTPNRPLTARGPELLPSVKLDDGAILDTPRPPVKVICDLIVEFP